jgi:hypothetical protein
LPTALSILLKTMSLLVLESLFQNVSVWHGTAGEKFTPGIHGVFLGFPIEPEVGPNGVF